MKKVWLASVIVVVVALVGVGVYWAYWLWPAPPVEREKPALTATVERGSLQRTVKALGAVGANPDVTLSFAQSGVVTLVSVEEGDAVVAGQVLAQLDTTDTNLAIQQAEAGLRAARAQLAIVQQGATPADLAAADAALIAAQAQLAEVSKGPLDSDYAAAQASLSSARAAYAELLDTTSGAETIEQARLAWEQAKNALWAAQAERDAIVARSSTSQAQKDQLEAGLNTAELGVEIAELAYIQAQEGPAQDDIEAAKATIAAAEAQVARLGVDTDAQVKSASAAVAQAEARIAALNRLPTDEAVEAGQAGVAQAEAALESARRGLSLLQLAAPSAGTIKSLNINPGLAVAATAPVLVIANEDRPPLEVLVNESLISEVQVGQSVRLTLDAYPGQLYTGQVSRIDSNSARMSQYPVMIELDNADGVMPGMLIEAEIIADEHADVLLAPRAALIWSQGEWSVDVWSSRQRQSAPVTVGIRTYDQAEIVSGLNEGDVVVIDPPPANTGEGMYTFSQMNPEGAVR